jgi:preprotein translocase subunit YajC
MSSLVFLLVIVVIFGVMISAQRRRQRSAMQVQHEVVPGSRIMTTAGLFATVVSVNDAEVELEVAPGVVSTYARAAIARVVDPGADGSHEALDDEDPDSPSEEDDR